MRIVCVNQDPGIGPGRKKGAAVHLQAMREAFTGLGADVLALDESEPARVAPFLSAEHARAPIDLVYERYALGRAAAARFCQDTGVPLVLEVNAPLAEEEARYRNGAADAEQDARDRALFSAARLVIAVSRAVAEYAVARGAAPERVHVRANGVDTERFRPRAAGDPVRARLVPAGRFALGFHGRLRPWHGFELFARAAQRLLAEGAPIQLVLVGEGEFEPHLAGRVAPERITRIPWVEHHEIGPYVASFDALPLTYDPAAPCYFSPLKLAEAMACGVVPVLPRLGDLLDAATDDVDAVFYPPGELEALVAALRGLLDEPARHQRLARAASASAGAKSWRAIAAFVLSSTVGGAQRA